MIDTGVVRAGPQGRFRRRTKKTIIINASYIGMPPSAIGAVRVTGLELGSSAVDADGAGVAAESAQTPPRTITGDGLHLCRALCLPGIHIPGDGAWCPGGMLDGVGMRPVIGAATAVAEVFSEALPSTLPAQAARSLADLLLTAEVARPHRNRVPHDRYLPIEITALDAAETLAASLVRPHPVATIARRMQVDPPMRASLGQTVCEPNTWHRSC